MLPLLVHLQSALTSDSTLTAIIPSENIGASLRQNAGSPAIEYGIDGETTDPSGHRTLTLVLWIYSATGPEAVYNAKERLETLLTALTLSTPIAPAMSLSFRAMQVRLTDSRALPRNEWAHSLRCEFSVKVADLRPRTQKQ